MWKSTFGRLPPASETALKHAVRKQPSRGPPRLLVPLPPNASRQACPLMDAASGNYTSTDPLMGEPDERHFDSSDDRMYSLSRPGNSASDFF